MYTLSLTGVCHVEISILTVLDKILTGLRLVNCANLRTVGTQSCQIGTGCRIIYMESWIRSTRFYITDVVDIVSRDVCISPSPTRTGAIYAQRSLRIFLVLCNVIIGIGLNRADSSYCSVISSLQSIGSFTIFFFGSHTGSNQLLSCAVSRYSLLVFCWRYITRVFTFYKRSFNTLREQFVDQCAQLSLTVCQYYAVNLPSIGIDVHTDHEIGIVTAKILIGILLCCCPIWQTTCRSVVVTCLYIREYEQAFFSWSKLGWIEQTLFRFWNGLSCKEMISFIYRRRIRDRTISVFIRERIVTGFVVLGQGSLQILTCSLTLQIITGLSIYLTCIYKGKDTIVRKCWWTIVVARQRYIQIFTRIFWFQEDLLAWCNRRLEFS